MYLLMEKYDLTSNLREKFVNFFIFIFLHKEMNNLLVFLTKIETKKITSFYTLSSFKPVYAMDSYLTSRNYSLLTQTKIWNWFALAGHEDLRSIYIKQEIKTNFGTSFFSHLVNPYFNGNFGSSKKKKCLRKMLTCYFFSNLEDWKRWIWKI